MRVCMLAFKGLYFLVSISLCILCVRDGWPFPWDFGLLSPPSVHTLMIWLFFMSWFEWISAHLFSFDLFVLLMVFHLPCVHCSLFILIYTLCSIFFTHHSYTSHQHFNILSFFSFIIDKLILDSFFVIDIFILDVLRSMVYETLCTYCILYTRVWGFIIRIIEPSFSSFLHPITLTYVTSWVLRPPWGHDIMHCVLIALTWAILGIDQRTFWLWWFRSCGMTPH